jgi:hypothetical protein
MSHRRSSSKLAAPFIVTAGLLPACGGAPTPAGNPPHPGVVHEHENPPAVDPAAHEEGEHSHGDGPMHTNPPPAEGEAPTGAEAPVE